MARLHSTSGGDIDTELKELAVKPMSAPEELRAVTMVTPVANMPNAARKWLLEKLGASALLVWILEGISRIYLKSNATLCNALNERLY